MSEEIVRLLDCYWNIRYVDGKIIDIKYFKHTLLKRLEKFTSFINLIIFLKDNFEKNFKIFGEPFKKLVLDLNEVCFSFVSGNMKKDREKFSNKFNSSLKELDDDILCRIFSHFCFQSFEEKLELPLLIPEKSLEVSSILDNLKKINDVEKDDFDHLYTEGFKKYGDEYYKFEISRKILGILTKAGNHDGLKQHVSYYKTKETS